MAVDFIVVAKKQHDPDSIGTEPATKRFGRQTDTVTFHNASPYDVRIDFPHDLAASPNPLRLSHRQTDCVAVAPAGETIFFSCVTTAETIGGRCPLCNTTFVDSQKMMLMSASQVDGEPIIIID
jgi:hypothetical protein